MGKINPACIRVMSKFNLIERKIIIAFEIVCKIFLLRNLEI